MSLSADELEQWTLAYIEGQREPGKATPRSPHWWAIEKFMMVESEEQAEDAWIAILEILSRDPPPDTFGILGAGALEDLIDRWGTLLIDRIEQEAAKSPPFRQLLGRVWRRNTTDEVWSRIQLACGRRREGPVETLR